MAERVTNSKGEKASCDQFVNKCFQYVNPFSSDCKELVKTDGTSVPKIRVKASLNKKARNNLDYLDPITGELKPLNCVTASSSCGFIAEREEDCSYFTDNEVESESDSDIEGMEKDMGGIKLKDDKVCTTLTVFKKVIDIALHLTCKVRICELSGTEFVRGNGRKLKLSQEDFIKLKWDILIASNKNLENLASNAHKLNSHCKKREEEMILKDVLKMKHFLLCKLQDGLFGMEEVVVPDNLKESYAWKKEEEELKRHPNQPRAVNQLIMYIKSHFAETIRRIQYGVADEIEFQNAKKKHETRIAPMMYDHLMDKEQQWQSMINKAEQKKDKVPHSQSGLNTMGQTCTAGQAFTVSVDPVIAAVQREERWQSKINKVEQSLAEKIQWSKVRKTANTAEKAEKAEKLSMPNEKDSQEKIAEGKGPLALCDKTGNLVEKETVTTKQPRRYASTRIKKSKEKTPPGNTGVRKYTASEFQTQIQRAAMRIFSREYRLVKSILRFNGQVQYPIIIRSIKRNNEYILDKMRFTKFQAAQWIRKNSSKVMIEAIAPQTFMDLITGVTKYKLMQRILDMEPSKLASYKPVLSVTKLTHVLSNPEITCMNNLLFGKEMQVYNSLKSLFKKHDIEIEALNKLSGCVDDWPIQNKACNAAGVDQTKKKTPIHILPFDNMHRHDAVPGPSNVPDDSSAILVPVEQDATNSKEPLTSTYRYVSVKNVLESTKLQTRDKGGIIVGPQNVKVVHLPKGSLFIKDVNVLIKNVGSCDRNKGQATVNKHPSSTVTGTQADQLFKSHLVSLEIIRTLHAALELLKELPLFNTMLKKRKGEGHSNSMPQIKEVFSLTDMEGNEHLKSLWDIAKPPSSLDDTNSTETSATSSTETSTTNSTETSTTNSTETLATNSTETITINSTELSTTSGTETSTTNNTETSITNSTETSPSSRTSTLETATNEIEKNDDNDEAEGTDITEGSDGKDENETNEGEEIGKNYKADGKNSVGDNDKAVEKNKTEKSSGKDVNNENETEEMGKCYKTDENDKTCDNVIDLTEEEENNRTEGSDGKDVNSESNESKERDDNNSVDENCMRDKWYETRQFNQVLYAIIGPRANINLNANAVFILKSFCNQLVLDKVYSEDRMTEIKILLEILGEGHFMKPNLTSQVLESDQIVIRCAKLVGYGERQALEYHIIKNKTFPDNQEHQFIRSDGPFHLFGFVPNPLELCLVLINENLVKTWVCCVCLKIFTDLNSYLAHETDYHSRCITYVCQICKKSFTNKGPPSCDCVNNSKPAISVTNQGRVNDNVEGKSAEMICVRPVIKGTYELCDACVYFVEHLDEMLSFIIAQTKVDFLRCDECTVNAPGRTTFNRHKSYHKLKNGRKLVLRKCQVCFSLYDLDVTDNQVQHSSHFTVENLRNIVGVFPECVNLPRNKVIVNNLSVSDEDIKEWKFLLSTLTDIPYGSGKPEDLHSGEIQKSKQKLDCPQNSEGTEFECSAEESNEEFDASHTVEQGFKRKLDSENNEISSDGDYYNHNLSEQSCLQAQSQNVGKKIKLVEKRNNSGDRIVINQGDKPNVLCDNKDSHMIDVNNRQNMETTMESGVNEGVEILAIALVEKQPVAYGSGTDAYVNNMNNETQLLGITRFRNKPLNLLTGRFAELGDNPGILGINECKAGAMKMTGNITEACGVSTESMNEMYATGYISVNNDNERDSGATNEPEILGVSVDKTEVEMNELGNNYAVRESVSALSEVKDGLAEVTNESLEVNESDSEVTNDLEILGIAEVKTEVSVVNELGNNHSTGSSSTAVPKVIDKQFARKHLMELLIQSSNEKEMKKIVSEALQWKLNNSKLFTENEVTAIVRQAFQILEARNQI